MEVPGQVLRRPPSVRPRSKPAAPCAGAFAPDRRKARPWVDPSADFHRRTESPLPPSRPGLLRVGQEADRSQPAACLGFIPEAAEGRDGGTIPAIAWYGEVIPLGTHRQERQPVGTGDWLDGY